MVTAVKMYALLPASCLGLLLTVLEFLAILPDEVSLIWARPPRLTLPKFLYILCRYFGLVAHAFYIILSHKVVSHYPEVPASTCKEWLYFQVIVTFVLLNAMDLVLMMRIYAFYRRGRRIGVLLCTVFVTRFFLAISSAIAFLPSQSFDECCRVLMSKGVMFCFLVTEMITQGLLLGLTFAKEFFSRDTHILRAPITSLIYRDGVLACGAVFMGLVVILMNAGLGLFWESTPFIFPIFTSILSASTCRMIINMQSLAAETPTVNTIELTDFLDSTGDMDDSRRNG